MKLLVDMNFGPSVVQVRTQDYLNKDTAALIVRAVNENADALYKGAILTIDAKRGRLRLLPL